MTKENLKIDQKMIREMNISILEQNMNKQEMSFYVAGYYKGSSTKNSTLWFVMGSLFTCFIIFAALLLKL